MKLKTVEIAGKTYAEVDGDKPVYVDDKGADISLDAVAMRGTISRLNAEAQGHREAKERAETSLKAFEGIEDPAAARKALETISNIDAGKLLEAGKVEDIKRQAKEAAQAEVAAAQKEAKDKIDAVSKERDEVQGQLNAELIGGGFARSKFRQEKVAVPADMLQALFGPNFKIEGGKPVGYINGQKIVSPEDFVSPASFDIALERMIDAYPFKDQILKGTGASGSQARGSEGSGSGGKTITRAEFSKLSPADQMAKMTTEGVSVVD